MLPYLPQLVRRAEAIFTPPRVLLRRYHNIAIQFEGLQAIDLLCHTTTGLHNGA